MSSSSTSLPPKRQLRKQRLHHLSQVQRGKSIEAIIADRRVYEHACFVQPMIAPTTEKWNQFLAGSLHTNANQQASRYMQTNMQEGRHTYKQTCIQATDQTKNRKQQKQTHINTALCCPDMTKMLIWARTGSPWLPMGSYSARTDPHLAGAFLNASPKIRKRKIIGWGHTGIISDPPKMRA